MWRWLKSRYWDVHTFTESSPNFFRAGHRTPPLRKVARFFAAHWKFVTASIFVPVMLAYFFR